MNNHSDSIAFSIRKKDLGNIIYPGVAYIDTSFILELLNNATYREDCYYFLEEATRNNNIFFISGEVEKEIEHILIKEIYEEEARKLNIKSNNQPVWRVLFETRKEYMKKVKKEYKYIEEFLEAIDISALDYISDEKHRRLMKNICFEFGLDTFDASHISIMFQEQNQLNSIITLDKHFMNIPSLNVYGPTKDIVYEARGNKNKINQFNKDFVNTILE